MSLTDKMKDFSSQAQEKMVTGTQSIFLFLIKTVSGLILGFTFSLIIHEIFKTGTLNQIFVTLLTTVVFVKLTASWKFGAIFIFDLIAVLVAMLLRMYILMAP